MLQRTWVKVLAAVIPLLLLADGTIHLLLNFVLFGGGGGGPRPGGPRPGGFTGTPPAGGFTRTPVPGGLPPGPRPGAGFNPLILPLNQLFVLNFVGAVVLTLVFLFVLWRFSRAVWLVDVLMIGYVAAAFGAWLMLGQPNPMGLGYLSKGIELVLILSLLTHIWTRLRGRVQQPAAAASIERPPTPTGSETAGSLQ